MDERLQVWYGYPATRELAAARAEAIALEQSVEMPRDVVPAAVANGRVVGEVEEVEEDGEGQYRARISFSLRTVLTETGPSTAQLVNVLFGNTSLQHDVRLLDAELPDSLLRAFRGPRLGIAGLRDWADAPHRPLAVTALKPVGLSAAQFGTLAATFARAGLDWIKDDHGIADQPWAPFRERVIACMAAVRGAAESTGREALYIPNLSGGPTRLFEQLEIARQQAVRAVMASPMLIGIPVFEELVRRAEEMAVIAHPALSGSPSIAPAFLFGSLYRLLGADAVIFVNFGGRFGYDRSECARLAENLRKPWGHMRAAFPVPAGGMTVERADEMVRFYGNDVALLVSGALYGPGDTMEREGRRLVEKVRGALSEQ